MWLNGYITIFFQPHGADQITVRPLEADLLTFNSLKLIKAFVIGELMV